MPLARGGRPVYRTFTGTASRRFSSEDRLVLFPSGMADNAVDATPPAEVIRPTGPGPSARERTPGGSRPRRDRGRPGHVAGGLALGDRRPAGRRDGELRGPPRLVRDQRAPPRRHGRR